MELLLRDVRLATEIAGTRVTYPASETSSRGRCVGIGVMADGSGAAVLLDSTAAHPRSPTWPDQPADRGVLRAPDGREHPLSDVRQGVVVDGELVLDTTAARAGGVEVVVHLIPPADIEIGDEVEVLVDVDFRRALSLAHSACHLASFALNAAVAQLWNKPVQRMDALGHPAFDPLAIQSSTMSPYRAVDAYRLGKSLRKKGFDVARLDVDLPAVTRQLRSRLSRWVAADSALSLDAGDGTLSARRSWSCRLDGIDVVMACGGTHPTSAGELAGIDSTLELSSERDELTMTTTVPRR
ncbi:MAG: metal-dependent hydrolase [Nakamurella sp.]